MAYLDDSTGGLVLRVAYDGPPLAGKTETLRSLGASLSVPVESFEEAYGRTLWFDWLRYAGGMFEGRPILCEVVALPGQSGLQERRNTLLADADAIVFVADVSRAGRDTTQMAMQRLRDWRRTRATPPSYVVQANKSDLPDAMSVTELRATLELPDEVPVIESVATDQLGVRHAFVYAVRSAVRHARERRDDVGALPTIEGTRDPRQVLADLRERDQQRRDAVRELEAMAAATTGPPTLPAPPDPPPAAERRSAPREDDLAVVPLPEPEREEPPPSPPPLSDVSFFATLPATRPASTTPTTTDEASR